MISSLFKWAVVPRVHTLFLNSLQTGEHTEKEKWAQSPLHPMQEIICNWYLLGNGRTTFSSGASLDSNHTIGQTIGPKQLAKQKTNFFVCFLLGFALILTVLLLFICLFVDLFLFQFCVIFLRDKEITKLGG